jgi:hypothetical protein
LPFKNGVWKVKYCLVKAVVIIILKDAGEANEKLPLRGGSCFQEFGCLTSEQVGKLHILQVNL